MVELFGLLLGHVLLHLVVHLLNVGHHLFVLGLQLLLGQLMLLGQANLQVCDLLHQLLVFDLRQVFNRLR